MTKAIEHHPLLEEDDVVLVGEEHQTTTSSSSSHSHDESSDSDPGTSRQVRAAAIAGCLAGLLLGGPILGLVAAGGAAAVATSRSQAGEVARSTGDAMADAGDRLKRFDEKHQIVDKTRASVKKGCQWASQKVQDRHSSTAAGLTA